MIAQIASKASRHPIFFPSRYVRPKYEMGTSQIRHRASAALTLISRSKVNRFADNWSCISFFAQKRFTPGFDIT
jgi:hypothetical protein